MDAWCALCDSLSAAQLLWLLPRFSAQPSCGNNKFAAREILCGPQPLHHDCTCIVLNEMMA